MNNASNLPPAVRVALNEFADAMVPLLKLSGNPWEQTELIIGPATRATVRFSGPVSAEAIDRLCSHLTLMREFAKDAAFLDATGARALLREMLEEHIARQIR